MENQLYLNFIDENFKFYPSCYIYKKNDTSELNILKLFNDIIKDWNYYFDENKKRKNKKNIKVHNISINEKWIEFIFEFFKYNITPWFIKKWTSFIDYYIEDKHWYLLIIKIDNFVFIQKTWWTENITNDIKKKYNLKLLNELYRNILLSEYEKLNKLKISNIKSNSKEFENIDYEWDDLVELINYWEYWNFFPKFLKAWNNNDKKKLSINSYTSRIQFSNQEIETTLTNLLTFYLDIKLKFELTNIEENKLISFQKNLTKKIDNISEYDLKPKYVSFNNADVFNFIDEIDDDSELNNYLAILGWYIELSGITDTEWKITYSGQIVTSDLNINIIILISKKENWEINDVWFSYTISQDSELLNKILNIIKTNSLFKIYFDDNKISFYNWGFFEIKTYEDQNINIIPKYLFNKIEPNINSEKWLYSEYQNAENNDFSDKSIFYNIENILNNDSEIKYIFCWDMWAEMADYIAFKEKEIIFIHWKSNWWTNNTKSVSVFSDVINQAIKNIWHLNLDKEKTINSIKSLNNKIDLLTWEIIENLVNIPISKWKTESDTIKKKVIKNTLVKWDSNNFENFLKKFKSDNLVISKKIIIAIDFFDKSNIETRLKNYDSSSFLDIQFINCLWSLISTCKIKWIEFEIWCK